MELADWLHRRLRRRGMPIGDEAQVHPGFTKPLLQRYRAQVAFLRSTLQRQLVELAADRAETLLSDEWQSKSDELSRPSKSARVDSA